jgi:hypothetical protein
MLRRNEHGAVLVIVRLRGAGRVEAPSDLVGDERWEVLLTTEDSSFASDARAIVLEGFDGSSVGTRRAARFERPGAVVLRAAR